MEQDETLQEMARRAIRTGRLPNRSPDRTCGGPGVDADCAICGLTVGPDEVELEVDFFGDDGESAQNHHFHVRCFSAWEYERRELEFGGECYAGHIPRSTPSSLTAGGRSE